MDCKHSLPYFYLPKSWDYRYRSSCLSQLSILNSKLFIFLLLSFWSSLCILHINSLQMYMLKILCCHICCLFIQVIVLFVNLKHYYTLMQVHLSVCFCFLWFWGLVQKDLTIPMYWIIFSLSTFIVSGFYISSLVYFQFIYLFFVTDEIGIFCIWISNFSQNFLVKILSFLQCVLLALASLSVFCRCVHLTLDSLFCYIGV
jgi:hypothetical protein